MLCCDVFMQLRQHAAATDALCTASSAAEHFHACLMDLEAVHGSLRQVLRDSSSLRQLSDITAGLCGLSLTDNDHLWLRGLAAMFPSFDCLAWHPKLCRHVAAGFSERLALLLRAVPAAGKAPADIVMALRAATVALRMVARATGTRTAERMHPLLESMCSAGVLYAIASHCPVAGMDVAMLLMHLLPDDLQNHQLGLLRGHQLRDLALGSYIHLRTMGAIMAIEQGILVRLLCARCVSTALDSSPALSAITYAHYCRSDMGDVGSRVPAMIDALTSILPSSATELEKRAYLHAAADISVWIVYANPRAMFTMETMAQVQGSMQALRAVLEREIELGKWSCCGLYLVHR